MSLQHTRRGIQTVMLAITLVGVFVLHGNCERWCPFGGVEALGTYIAEGNMICSLGVSNFFILAGVLLATLLLRRAFCGYLCPIGTLSEWLQALGRRLGLPTLTVPPRADRALALAKYVLLAVILYFTWQAGELIFRGFDPCYALISRHGPDITSWAYVSAAAVAVASLVMMVPFCRWFCPLAAVLNPFSRFALARVKRDPQTCTNCRQCAKACPMQIEVDRLQEVTAARCVSCLNCLDKCRSPRGHALRWGPPEMLGRQWSQAVLVLVLVGCTSAAVAASYWFPMASFVRSSPRPLPAQVAVVELQVDEMTCRGRGNLLYFFLERDDLYQVPGWFRIEAWPGPGYARVRMSYDAGQGSDEAIRKAITEPYFDVGFGWRMSPFRIQGYDPLGLGLP